MKLVHLNALKIDVPVPDNYFFHDEGEVDDISLHLLSLFSKYWKSPEDIPEINQQLGGAYMITRVYFPSTERGELFDEVHSHIFISKSQSAEDKMFSRGHEETHFLIDVEKIELLQQALTGEGIRKNSLEGLTFEAICNVGGFYSLITHIPCKKYRLAERSDDPEFLDWLKANTSWV